MQLTDQEKAVGRQNFDTVVSVTRRDFLKGAAAAVAVPGAGLGAFYFGYEKVNDPVRVAVIGTGDEGSVLMSNITPDYIQVVAIADIRPYNQWRAFHGDPANQAARMGLIKKYKYGSEEEAKKHIKVFTDYKEALALPEVEAVIIAVPLFQHHEVAMAAMEAGKHVLCEKLMAHNIGQCKEMGKRAESTGKILAVGHQRHYSVLYDDAVQAIRNGAIGDIHFIRAQWHRGNLPGKGDSWKPDLPQQWADKIGPRKDALLKAEKDGDHKRADDLRKQILLWEMMAADGAVDAKKYGYIDFKSPDGKDVTALEELLRWRLWNRTGGGLMAELGSHQLDASSIFVSSMYDDGRKVKPLTVNAVGGRHIFPGDRECEDHVYCTYEFPAPGYESDPNKKVCATYSSINGNGWGDYGETVMGTKGTLILHREQETFLFGNDKESVVSVKEKKDDVVVSYESGGGAKAVAASGPARSGPVSRGYTEEMEHWAWCIRNQDNSAIDPKDRTPRCHPAVAMADAIIALTTNIAIRENKRIDFKKEWFEINSPATPEDDLLPKKTPVA